MSEPRRDLPDDAPRPQPEHDEPRLDEPGPRQLSRRDYRAALLRAVRESSADHVTDTAAAVTYYAFLAIPAAMLIVVGVFGLVAEPAAIPDLLDIVAGLVPTQVLDLIEGALRRTIEERGRSAVLVATGGLVALWTATSAMAVLIRALNLAYDRGETRRFGRQRTVEFGMLGLTFLATVLVFVALVLGGYVSDALGEALGLETVFAVLWWTAQWPVLAAVLLVVFATILYIGPDVAHPRWVFVTFGALVAVVAWLLSSGLFALYASRFGSYNETWGPLSAVVVLLTWLWLSTLALLFGAEVNAEVERSRELRAGEPAEREIQAPTHAGHRAPGPQ